MKHSISTKHNKQRESKVCVVCNSEKSNDSFNNKYEECKPCNIETKLRRYYDNKDKYSYQRKIYFQRNSDVLIGKSKVNQQNRKSHTQQIKDLNNKVEELTQAMEKLYLKN